MLSVCFVANDSMFFVMFACLFAVAAACCSPTDSAILQHKMHLYAALIRIFRLVGGLARQNIV